LGNEIWIDQELSGGQEWWDQILTHIRDSDIIIVVISEDSLNSDACEREYRYALALGKPVIPVMIDESVSTKLLPRELASLEIVDFTVSDKNAAISLAGAISMSPSPTSLPNPLSLAREVPTSYLGKLSERVNSSETLSAEEQATLLVDVKTGFRNAKTSKEGRIKISKNHKKIPYWKSFFAMSLFFSIAGLCAYAYLQFYLSSSYSEDTAIIIAGVLTITALFITYLSYISSFKWIWLSRVLNVSGYVSLGLMSGSILSEMSYDIETGSPTEIVQLSIWAIGMQCL